MVEDKKTITIDEIEYTEDQLTDKAKHCINQVSSLDQKIRNMGLNIEQMQVGRGAYLDMLRGSLQPEEVVN